MSIRKQLLLISIVSAVPLILAGAIALYSLWQTSKSEIAKSLEQRAQLAAVALEKWIDAQRQPLNMIAAYHNAGLGLSPNHLGFMVNIHPHWIDLRIVNREWQEVSTWPANAAPLSPKLTNEMFSDLQLRRTWVITTDWTQSADNPTLIIAVPLEGGGAIVVQTRAEAMKEVFQDVELPDGSSLSIFDLHGRVLYHSAEEVVGVDITTSPLFNALEKKQTALLNSLSPFDGVPHMYGLSRAGRTGCIVKIGVPSVVLYRPAWEQFTRYLIYSGLALLCSLIASLFIAHSIARPIRRLRHMAHRLGRDSVIVSTGMGGRGEVAELSEAFKVMAEQITEREESLRDLNKRLEELNELKSEVVSGVSHELRTPLTTIKMLARLMLHNELSEAERRESLEVIATECDRQIDLVLNLLDLSRIEAGAFHYTLSEVNLLDVLHACLRIERHTARLHGHDIDVDLPAHLPHIQTDRKAVRRILCALIENAIKYTPDGGRIALSADVKGDGIVIEISDTGRGITAEDLPHVFDKFYRGHMAALGDSHNSRRRNGASGDFVSDVPGVGLGLYLARTIIEQLGGHLSVISEVGRGSSFFVKLPLTQEQIYRDENKGE